MNNTQASHIKLVSRVGLAVSGLIVIAATSLPVATASAQSLLVKFDGKDIELKRKGSSGEGSNNSNDGGRKFQQITIGKGDREEGATKKRQVPTIAIGKGDRNEDEGKTKSQQIVIGKGDREEGSGKKAEPRILIGKGDRKKDEGKVVKRQIIVEKAKPKKVVAAAPAVVKKKKVVVAAAPAVVKKKVVVAAAPAVEKVEVVDAEPVVEETPEAATEAPVEEQVVTEEAPAPVEAVPAPAFKVGQIVTAGDGNSYVIVKVDATGISAMPLTAFTNYEEPQPVYKPVSKKRKYKKRYSTYRSYGGSSCH
jgi:hypothetical protein